MSTGFRIFLLILLGFSVVSLYRMREVDIAPLMALDGARASVRDEEPSSDERGWATAAPLEDPVASVFRGHEHALDYWSDGGFRLPEPEDVEPTRHVENPGRDWWPEPPAAEPTDLPRVVPVTRPEGDPDLAFAPDEEIVNMAEPQFGADPDVVPPVKGPPEHDLAKEEDHRDGDTYEEILYEVQDKDRLWTIAARLLGSGAKWRAIADLNRDVLGERNTVRAGMTLRVRLSSEKVPNPLKSDSEIADTPVEQDPAIAPKSRPEVQLKTHTVRSGETLVRIARKYFPGDPLAATRLFEANRDQLRSPDHVEAGQVLKLPIAR